MGLWEDRLRSHAVHGTFETVLTALDSLSAEQVEQAPDEVERLIWVVGHVRERLRTAPPMSVPAQCPEQLNAQLNQVNQAIAQYAATGQVPQLGNANNAADTLLELARVLPPLPPDVVTAEAGAYLERISGMVSTVVGDAAKDRERLHDAADALDARLTSTAQQLEQLEAGTRTQVTKLDQAIAAQENQFDRAQGERLAAFREAEQERAQAAEAAAEAAGERFATTAGELTDQAAGTLKSLAELKRQAEELVGAIGVAGVAAGYNETAQREERVADVWRWATVAVALLAAGVLVAALFVDHSADGSWQRLATRLLVSLSFAGVAAYCGRESAAHRRVAREARARHLQLAALNPYLANMPEEESIRLKGELAPGYFAPASTDRTDGAADAGSGGPLSREQLTDLVQALITKGSPR
ncbi:hypothetical protein [Blastococcus sp. PRF04-17]|uniref:hypothetical protein n=1 Tax=Blastococcus sp. PRF04-17 TaxID=2933797 RepID=UPI001FF583BB|nr:hypothetical protein [Blastococcus sp. PRF04-17]UOY01634.1 hypothetical protein MVA48_22390 [Blastococcus sp. PRF04-17]